MILCGTERANNNWKVHFILMKNREISNRWLCEIFPLIAQRITCRIHASLLCGIYIGIYCFKWIWCVVETVNCIPNCTATDNAIFIVHIDAIYSRSALQFFARVIQKLQHFRMCQSISVVLTNTYTDYCNANCRTLTIPFIIAPLWRCHFGTMPN